MTVSWYGTKPDPPSEGDAYIDPTTGNMHVYTGRDWSAVLTTSDHDHVHKPQIKYEYDNDLADEELFDRVNQQIYLAHKRSFLPLIDILNKTYHDTKHAHSDEHNAGYWRAIADLSNELHDT